LVYGAALKGKPVNISVTPLLLDSTEAPSLGALEEWIETFPPLVIR